MSEVQARGSFELIADADQFEAAMAKAEATARRVEGSVVKSMGNAAGATAKLGDGADGGAQKLDRATLSIKSSIERMIAATQAGTKGTADFYQALANTRGADLKVLDPYIAKLRDLEAAQKKAAPAAVDMAKSMGLVGVSAGQTNAALRQLPAQFTDIFTSLASGQNVLTVFLQQGGQIKDSFGGIGNAARAIAASITPMSVALTAGAAAIGVLGYAVLTGAKELTAFRQALAFTGNAAGDTASGLSASAFAVSSSVGTYGKAAETLAALASTGRVASKDLQLLAEAAIRLERDGGPAVEETVKQFAALGKDPTKASATLNEQTRYLTGSLYEQIRALELNGKAAEAASLAQTAYAKAVTSRAKELEASLGSLERGWRSVGDSAKEAWDAMLSVGRPQSQDEAVKAMQLRIAQLRGAIESTQGAFGASTATDFLSALFGGKGALQEQLDNLNEVIRLMGRAKTAAGELAAEQAAAARASLAAQQFGDLAQQYKTPGDKLREAVAQVRELGEAGKKSADEIKALVAQTTAYSQANALAVAAAQATLAGNAQIRAEQVAGSIQRLQQQLAVGVLNEYEAISKIAEVEIEASKAEEQRLAASEDLARAIPNNEAAIRAARAATLAQLEKTANLENKLAGDIDTALNKRRVAAALAFQAQVEENEASRRAYDDSYLDRLNRASNGIQEYAIGLQDAAYAHSEELRASLLDDRQRDIRLRQLAIELDTRRRIREVQALKLDAVDESSKIDAIKKQAADASAAVADQVTQTFDTRVYLSVRDTLTDAILEGGQAGAKRLEDLFKQLVLRPIVQAGVASLLGSLGIGQAAATAGGIGGLAGIGSGLASGFNGFATSSLGQALGLSSAFDIGGGSGITVMLPNGAASGIGSALSSIGPYAAAAALIFSVAQGLDKSGTPHTGSVVTADLSGVRTGGSDPSNILGHLNAQTDAALKTLTGAGVGLLNTLASTFGGAANFSAQAKFAADGVDASFGGFQLFRNGQANRQIAGTVNNDAARYGSDPTQAFAAYSQDVAKTLRSALDDLNLPQWARDQINALGDSADFDKLNAVATSIAQTSKAFGDFQKTLQPFGGIFSDIAGLTSDALATLANSAGGLDQLKASTSAYFEGYFSDAEKAAMQTAALSQALAAVGLQLPDTREQFRALVDQQAALGDSGRPALAALLGVAGAFADLHPALQATADAARSAADILKERTDLETQLLRAQGNTSALRERELAALDASNRALQQQLYDIADTQAASEALARSLQDVAAAETRVTNAQQGVKSALQALADFGANLRAQAADTQRAIDDLRRQAASALVDANSQVQASLAALASASESASQRVTAAAQAIQAAQDRKTSAGASLRSYIEQQRQGVTDAQGGVLSALDGLRSARESALSAQQAERDKITEAYTNAQDAATAAAERLAQIQGKASTSAADLAQQMGKLRDSIGDYLAELTGSSSGLATQAAVNKATFLDLAQRAKAGDSTAISQLLGSAKAFDAASLAGSATGAEYDAARRLIRTVLGDLQSSIGSAGGVDTAAAQADLDKALAEVERLRGIAEEAGASLTKNSVDLLAEWRQSQLAASAAVTAYNDAAATVASLGLTQGQQADAWSSALATLSTAQTKLSAALAAAQAAGIQPGAVADPLQAIIDELTGAKGALDKANSEYGIALIAQASSAAALADAQSKASAAGVSIAGTTTDLSTNFAAVLAAFVAAKADVTTLGEAAASPTLLEQYQALSAKLTGINTDIAAFDEAVKGIDFSPLDTLTPLGGLLNTYSNAVNELLAAVGKQGQLTATGSFIDIGGGFSKYNSAAGATAVGKTGGDLTFFGKDGTSYQQSGIAEYVRQLIEAGDFRTIYNRALAFGLTSDDLNKFANGAGTTVLSWARSIGLPSFATGGTFGGGLRLVGEMGPEVEATGAARYYSTAQTQQMLRYGSDDVSAETKALREEVKALREDLNAALTALAGYASRQTRLQERWDGGGLLVRGDNSLPVYTKAAT